MVLAWDEAPAREFIEQGRTGLLADPTDPDAAARLALAAWPTQRPTVRWAKPRRRCAREHYSQEATLPVLAEWFDQLVQAAALRGSCTFFLSIGRFRLNSEHGARINPPSRLEVQLSCRTSFPLSVAFAGNAGTTARTPNIAGVRWRLPPPWPRTLGEALGRAASSPRRCGRDPDLAPDVVVGHGGLIPTLLLREVLSCPIVDFCEYYFAFQGRDLTYRLDLPPAEPTLFYPRCITPPLCSAWRRVTPLTRHPLAARIFSGSVSGKNRGPPRRRRS